MSAEYRIELDPVTPETADEAQAALFDKAKKSVGMIPNMYANMANSPGVLSTYLHGYELFRSSGVFTPPEQETVFLVLSRENGCDYCVSAHSMIAATKSKVPADALAALREGRELPDAKLEALARFTRRMHETRGLPTRADVEAFKAAGYGDRHILEIVLAMAVKTLSNYSNHLFHTEVDKAFASQKWEGRKAA